MAPSTEFTVQKLRRRTQVRLRRWRVATLLMVGLVILSAGVAIAWFANVGQVEALFERLSQLQNNPPMWLEPPTAGNQHLILPALSLLALMWTVTRIAPVSRIWARYVVVTITLLLTMRYMMWRSLTTLNLDNPLNGVFSLLLLAMEMLVMFSGSIQLFLLFNIKNRSPQADRLEPEVAEGRYRPTVDILIPSYDEAEFILRRTIIGCQAIDYEPKTVYLLDDTRRPWAKALAEELGCEYRTRPDNQHAKAGNLNHALPTVNGEIVVVFDADFVPTKNFLRRTIGFFQDQKIALVQTPQSFYNPDPIAHNLGLEDVLTPEEELFYRQIQPLKDGAGSVVCAGTAFLVRRSALDEAGGFFTQSLTEDYFTGIGLSARGYRLVYLDEKLSAGLAAENISSHIAQRLRWAQGTLQAFFVEANPLTIPGLTWRQRLAHLEGLLNWFTSFSRIVFLMMPLVYSFLDVIPVQTTLRELLYYFLPLYLVQLSVFSWLNCKSRSVLLSDIYFVVSAFPIALTVIHVMLAPFSKPFKVTPKGVQSDRLRFNWGLSAPIALLFVATALSLWLNFGRSMMYDRTGLTLGWIWSAYNLVILGVTLLMLLDIPQPEIYQWFRLRRIARLEIGDRTFWGFTSRISEVGLEVLVTQTVDLGADPSEQPVKLELVEEKLPLQGKIIKQDTSEDFPRLKIQFEDLKLAQQRRLVQLLFCRPGQWLSRRSPGELQSLLLLFRILLMPYALFGRQREDRGVAVAQVEANPISSAY